MLINLIKNIWALEVPENSSDFQIINPSENKYGTICWYANGVLDLENLSEGNWEIIGIVTKYEITFDFEKYLEKII